MAGRPPTPPRTRLGLAIRQRRTEQDQGQIEAAKAIGIPRSTLAGLELGRYVPSVASARALAKWLGEEWTAGRVIDAAETPAEPSP